MITYRIRHKASGYYYTPVKTTTYKGWKITTNLNKVGKIYTRRPDLKEMMGHGFRNHLKPIPRPNIAMGITFYDHTFEQFNQSDWLIEEM